MKKFTLLIIFAIIALGCKDNGSQETQDVDEVAVTESKRNEIEENESARSYPSNLAAIFNAHGGIQKWNAMNNLCFEMDAKGGTEIHTISLKDRKSKIEHKKWSIGFDGQEVWLLENEENAYQGNARFYHNLMFYFYAMPFVTGDDGIRYSDVEPRNLDGEMLPGIKISYESGVGDSPEDEYIIFFDPKTNKMKWLGYTVTYHSNEKSTDWHYIKYDKWATFNGLLLPTKMTWYEVKNGIPSKENNDLVFSNIIIAEKKLEDSMFKKPTKAEKIEK